jgi:hypothetical protein
MMGRDVEGVKALAQGLVLQVEPGWSLLSCLGSSIFEKGIVELDFQAAALLNLKSTDRIANFGGRESEARHRMKNFDLTDPAMKGGCLWKVLEDYELSQIKPISTLRFPKSCHPGKGTIDEKCNGFSSKVLEALVESAGSRYELGMMFREVWKVMCRVSRFELWFLFLFLCAGGKHRSVGGGVLAHWCMCRMGFTCKPFELCDPNSKYGCPLKGYCHNRSGCSQPVANKSSKLLDVVWGIWCEYVLIEPFMT